MDLRRKTPIFAALAILGVVALTPLTGETQAIATLPEAARVTPTPTPTPLPPTPTPTPVPPTPPPPPPVNPCDSRSLSEINFDGQDHDGVSTGIWGGLGFQVDAATGLNFQVNLANDIFTACIRNPNTQALINNPNPGLFRDFGTFGASFSTLSTFLNGNIQAPQFRINDTQNCFLCGSIRKGGCFDPEAELTLADGSTKTAGEISAGDKLWNPVLKKGVEVLKIVEGPEELPLIAISYGEKTLKISQDHPVLTAEGTKMAHELSVGDIVFDGEGQDHHLTHVENLEQAEGQRVINFILNTRSNSDDEHMLLSDGIISGDLILQLMLATRS